MQRIVLAALSAVSIAAATGFTMTSWSLAQATALGPSPGDAGAGFVLGPSGAQAQYLRVTAGFPAGNCYLAGSGYVRVWALRPAGDATEWARNPDLDRAVSVSPTTCSGAPCRWQAWPSLATDGLGRVYGQADSVTVVSGDGGFADANECPTVTVRIDARSMP